MADLFSAARTANVARVAPLAARMRPRRLADDPRLAALRDRLHDLFRSLEPPVASDGDPPLEEPDA